MQVDSNAPSSEQRISLFHIRKWQSVAAIKADKQQLALHTHSRYKELALVLRGGVAHAGLVITSGGGGHRSEQYSFLAGCHITSSRI